MTDASHRAAVAERSARAGGVVARGAFRRALDVETKENKNDLVTETDRDAQAQVVATVRQEFADDAFLLEEEVQTRTGPESSTTPPKEVDAVPETGAAWIVDPIDGTANFVRGLRTWCTSVAAVVEGRTQASATFMPAADDLFAAGPESVTRNDETMTVSDRDDPETFAVSTVGYWPRERRGEFGTLSETTASRFGDVRRFGSFQATLAFVADGGLDAAICTQPTSPWDTVAGVHLVRRAGGTVTDLDGEKWVPDDVGLVASNGEAHDAVLEATQDVLDPSARPER